MLPNLNEHGLLPEGIHDCTFEEAETRFGRFQESDRRPQLWANFRVFFRQAKACGFGGALLIDGSFVTAKAAPNDIDLLLVLPKDWDLEADVSPDCYNVISRNRVRQRFGFDMLVAREYSKQYSEYLALLQKVRGREHLRKGMLRLVL